jgi:NAD(P)-dependent dehydrogenase (short-subunit alcohol dehydrogenase family)
VWPPSASHWRETAREPRRVNVVADDLADPQNQRLVQFLAGPGSSFITGQVFGLRCGPIAIPSPAPNWNLAPGSWILVSGGAGFIGEAIVRTLHRAGYRILIGYLRPERAAKLAHDIDPTGTTCRCVPLDVESVDADTVHTSPIGSHLDELAGIVLCGGWNRTHRFSATDPAEWERTLRTNFTGAAQLVASAIENRRAPLAVVAIGSESSRIGDRGRAVYAAAKAALASHLSELAARNPRVFAMTVAPGPVDTELMRSTYPSPEAAEVGIEK